MKKIFEWIKAKLNIRSVVRRSNLYNSKTPSKDYCGRCKHICVSIHCNDHTICGLYKDSVHWYNVCDEFQFVNKRWFVHVGNKIIDYYYKD